MKLFLSFAEYSVVNAVRALPPPSVAMLMSAVIHGNRTWLIEAEDGALTALLTAMKAEIGASPNGSVAAEMLPRVVAKVEDLLRLSGVASAGRGRDTAEAATARSS